MASLKWALLALTLIGICGAPASARAVESILVYSGTFDPPHEGHRQLIEHVQASFHPTSTYVVTNLASEHKTFTTPYAVRKQMAELAFSDLPGTQVSPLDIESAFARADMRGVIDAIQANHPQAEVYQIMGDDSYERFLKATKNRPIKGVTILVVKRNPSASVIIPSGGTPARILEFEEKGHSSSSARDLLRKGEKPDFVSPNVLAFIKKQQLYATPTERGECASLFLIQSEYTP